MSETPTYVCPTFIITSRRARPSTVLLAEGAPGPRAHMPAFTLATRPFGPLTRTSGACGPVDMALLRMYIFGSARQRTAVSKSGRCSGPQPAMTALSASFSTVAIPKPGPSVATTSAGHPGAPHSLGPAAGGVRGADAKPRDQPRRGELQGV